MPTLILLLVVFPLTVISQSLNTTYITRLSESVKYANGTCKPIIKSWTSEDLKKSTISLSDDLKTLKMSFYSEPFKFDKKETEDNQEKMFYSRGKEVVILNLAKAMASYWDGITEKDLSKRFIHYYLE